MSRTEYQREWKRKKREDPEFRLKAAENQRRFYAKNKDYKDKHFLYRLKTRYGITGEQYVNLLRQQEECCAVCGRHYSEFSKRLSVDHDHHTLELRGLLCTNCNTRVVGRHRLGKGDELLLKAYNYLNGKYTGWFAPSNRKKKRRGKNRSTRNSNRDSMVLARKRVD